MFCLFVLGCQPESRLEAPVEIDLVSPEYGAFLGEQPVVVAGRVSNPLANVRVEGELVDVGTDGWFSVELPVDGAYRNIDVMASRGTSMDRERIPVFSGQDPMETWPGAMTARLTPDGLLRLGETLGAVIDDTGWDELLLAALPDIVQPTFSIRATEIAHEPTLVLLRPVDGGIEVGISLREISLKLEAEAELFGATVTIPIAVGYELIEVGAVAIPRINEDGVIELEMTETFIDFEEPVIEVFGFDLDFLDFIFDGINALIEPLGEFLVDQILGVAGVLELGGPIEFETDLMGMSLAMRLSELYTQTAGVGLGLGIGLNEPVPEPPLGLMAPIDQGNAPEEVHLALAIHEGLLQGMLGGEMLDLLSQDIELPGALGSLIGTAIKALPGGEQAPEAEGWCLKLNPGTARVARLAEGLEPMGALYLPDVGLEIGAMTGGWCEPWLTASIAMDVNLVVKEGTKIGVDLVVSEGAVLDYGSTGPWAEDDVIAGLGSLVQSMTSLLGGQLSFDLADMLGGLGGTGGDDPLGAVFGDLEPRIVWCEPFDVAGAPAPEGTYVMSLALWPTN